MVSFVHGQSKHTALYYAVALKHDAVVEALRGAGGTVNDGVFIGKESWEREEGYYSDLIFE